MWPVAISDEDADQLEGIFRHTDLSAGLTLMISSPGGDGEAAERIVNLCRTFSGTGDFRVVIPGKAKSAATIITFGASEIIMGPSSELGPVDPQIIFLEKDRRRQRSAYNMVMSYDELFNKAVASKGKIEPYLQQLAHYDARDIQRYRELMLLADDIAVKTLAGGMMSKMKETEVKKKIEIFLKPERTKSHGRPIFRKEALACGLNIKNIETFGDKLGDLVYELYIRSSSFVSSSNACKCIESRMQSVIQPVPSGWKS